MIVFLRGWGMNIARAGTVSVLVVVSVLALLALIGVACDRDGPMGAHDWVSGGPYETNGEQIYFTCTSSSGEPIYSNGGGMMHGMQWCCADCHGSDGRGRDVTMMMYSFHAPNICYDTLTAEHHDHDDDHMPYTDETIRRAITEGLDPDGERLDAMMPIWTMTDEDLDDLMDHLKTLE